MRSEGNGRVWSKASVFASPCGIVLENGVAVVDGSDEFEDGALNVLSEGIGTCLKMHKL